MVENTIVEILNPMTTFGNTDYEELAHIGNGCPIRCGISFNYRNNFSLTNPPYTSLIFLSFYPEFKTLFDAPEPNVYLVMFNKFANMANHCLNAKRFGEYDWEYLMSAFIAHYITLFLQKMSLINEISPSGDIKNTIMAMGNQSMGLVVEENVGGEQIKVDNMINVGINKDAGLYMSTPYGREFWDKYISYAKLFFRGVY